LEPFSIAGSKLKKGAHVSGVCLLPIVTPQNLSCQTLDPYSGMGIINMHKTHNNANNEHNKTMRQIRWFCKSNITSQQIESKCIYNLPPEFDPVFFLLGYIFYFGGDHYNNI
jgi:hypothetical protein